MPTKWVDFKILRAHLNFQDVVEHFGYEIHGKGQQVKILCPFHDDHKPSCGVNLTKNVYNCFSCGAGGNALDFFAHIEELDPDNPAERRKAALMAAEVFGIDAAMRLHGLSIPTVSTFGSSVSTEQVELLVQNGFKKAVLIFDGDEGGRSGIEQALPLLAARLFTRSIHLPEGIKPDVMDEKIVSALPRYC